VYHTIFCLWYSSALVKFNMSRVEDIFEVIDILFDIYYAIKNSEYGTKSQNISTIGSYCNNKRICNQHLLFSTSKKPSLVALTPEYVFFLSFIRELDLMCIFRNNIVDFSFLSSFCSLVFLRYNPPALIIHLLFPIPCFGMRHGVIITGDKHHGCCNMAFWNRKTQAFKLGYGEA